jgi:hypothetical protein
MIQGSPVKTTHSRWFASAVIVLSLAGCVRGCGHQRESMAPEKVVESYLNTALNMKSVSEREDLMQYTTGRLKEALASASEETIKNAYVNRHYELESYAVIERRDRTPRETEITFRLKYKDLGTAETRPADSKSAPTVQTENSVALLKEKGVWFIRDVVGAKTSIDFPVSQENEIRAKPGVITEPGTAETTP